jgi:NifU-like protein involved in Fe-S cluster formation
MTDKLRQAAQQVLVGLERAVDALQDEKRYVRAACASLAITALRAALAEQPAKQPPSGR